MMFWSDHDMSGWGYAGMAIGMVLFWVLIIVGIIALVRYTAGASPARTLPAPPPYSDYETPEQLPILASLAKAKLNELVKRVTNEAVQMHGGIGVTDELEIGFFLKRARVAMQIFGDTGYHKDRYATLCGY